MKNNSKYDKQVWSRNVIIFRLAFIILLPFILIASCKNKEQQHVASNKIVELDGLTQSVDRVVFSDVKVIIPGIRSESISTMVNGIIKYNPTLQRNISIRFSGRIERLYISHNYEEVKKGQRIMDIYSPDIISEQENLIQIISSESAGNSLQIASEKKLELLGVTINQIKSIITTKKVINPLPIYSDFTGIILDKENNGGMNVSEKSKDGSESGMNKQNTTQKIQSENVLTTNSSGLTLKEGMYIQKDQSILAIYNTDVVWAVLNVFPIDANNVRVGDKAILFSEIDSAKKINLAINYIEPVLGKNISSIEARVYVDNKKHQLKIGSLVSAKIYSTSVKGMWLPKSSVIDLGKDQIVFKKEGDKFVTKTVKVGIRSDSYVQIVSGINEKDSVALIAQYLVDSESFINKSSDE